MLSTDEYSSWEEYLKATKESVDKSYWDVMYTNPIAYKARTQCLMMGEPEDSSLLLKYVIVLLSRRIEELQKLLLASELTRTPKWEDPSLGHT